MAKTFETQVDIVMSSTIFVDAECEEDAKNIVSNWIGDDPHYYLRDAAYVKHEIIDILEVNNEFNN